MQKRLSGKVAIVTGSSKGIGAGIARRLADEGAAVVVNYVSGQEQADKLVQEIQAAGGRAAAVQARVGVASEAQALVDAALSSFGQLDILVNNAGVFEMAPADKFDEKLYDRMFDTNVRGVFLVTNAALPHLKEGAAIVHISSNVNRLSPPMSSIYAATKGAVDSLTRVMAKELGARKIRVNAVSPGYTETEGTRDHLQASDEMIQQMVAQVPLGRAGQPDDVAKAVAFLVSDEAAWITGEILGASGGM